MKKLTEEEKARYAALAHRRQERNLIRKAKERKDPGRSARLRSIRKARYQAFSSPIYELAVPERLSLKDNYDQVVKLVQDMRMIALSERQRVGLNFGGVTEVGPATALYVAAEVYRCRHIQEGQRRVTGKHPADRKIARLLKEMGFNDLLGIDDPTVSDEAPDVEYIPFSSSNRVDGTFARELRQALEHGSAAISPEVRRVMYGSLTEAMANVIHHAYPSGAERDYIFMQSRWWMAGSIDRSKNELMMMLYDQGVGIPNTIPRTHPVEHWGGLLSSLGVRPDDGNMIKVATMLGRTQTGEEHRGRGLQDVIEFVRVSEQGDLRILSNRGEYTYNSDGSDSVCTRRRDLGGTLIQWRVSRSSAGSDGHA